jgi:hypothetical protein
MRSMVAVSVASDENDGRVAYLSKSPCHLNPLAAAFETNVHQDNIGLITHCKQEGLLSICR